MTPQETANQNILFVLQKIKGLQLENSGNGFEYRLGGLHMRSEEEARILNMLGDKGLIEIRDSWGNDSFE